MRNSANEVSSSPFLLMLTSSSESVRYTIARDAVGGQNTPTIMLSLLAAPVTRTVTLSPFSITVGDTDRDGVADALTSASATTSTST